MALAALEGDKLDLSASYVLDLAVLFRFCEWVTPRYKSEWTKTLNQEA